MMAKTSPLSAFFGTAMIRGGSILSYCLQFKSCMRKSFVLAHTVDGRNPANQLIGSLSHYLHGFIHPRWSRISSINRIMIESPFLSGNKKVIFVVFHPT